MTRAEFFYRVNREEVSRMSAEQFTGFLDAWKYCIHLDQHDQRWGIATLVSDELGKDFAKRQRKQQD